MDRDLVVLGAPRLQRCDLCRARGALAALGHVLDDLRAPLREVLDHLPRHPDEVGDTVLDRLPAHTELVAQPPPELRLIQVPRSLRVAVQGTAVQRSPALVRALRP